MALDGPRGRVENMQPYIQVQVLVKRFGGVCCAACRILACVVGSASTWPTGE